VTAGYGIKPGHQLRKCEWLGEVVVCAYIESVNDVVFLVAAVRMRTGRGARSCAKRLHQLKSVQPRQPNVQHDGIELIN